MMMRLPVLWPLYRVGSTQCTLHQCFGVQAHARASVQAQDLDVWAMQCALVAVAARVQVRLEAPWCRQTDQWCF